MPTRGSHSTGWKWGVFTTRLPLYHTHIQWSELGQGVTVAAATGLALVPVLESGFGLSFEAAVACVCIHTVLIASSPIIFGIPLAPGWITPALPLALSFVLNTYPEYGQRFQAMTATALNLMLILLVMAISGGADRFMKWLPPAFKGGILLAASLSAFKRVLIDDSDDYFFRQPVATLAAVTASLLLLFSEPVKKLRMRHRWLNKLVDLGLLPGLVTASVFGLLSGEIELSVDWGILVPDFHRLFQQASPLHLGWPSLPMFVNCLPLALTSYILLFTDIVTGQEILKTSMPSRPDERVSTSSLAIHLSLAVRNTLMAVTAPFFPSQGILWTGVHVIIVRRWARGHRAMRSLYDGLASYYQLGLPFVYFLLPFVTLLEPLMGIAFTLTLALTGFACASVGMGLCRSFSERGTALLIAAAFVFLPAWVGLSVGLAAVTALTGRQSGR